MPANKNAMTRYKILDELLSDRYHNYSLDDLTEEVSRRLSELYPDTNGVGRRQIEKDINYLEYEGPFNVDIERYSADGYNNDRQKSYIKKCLRYANPTYSIFKKDLSRDEEYLLKEALSILGRFDGLPNLDGLEGLRLGLGVGRRDDRRIISLSKNPLENSNLLGTLFSAISQRQVVELHYHRFSEPDADRACIVYPYLLKEYNRRWFLFASTEADGKFLCFGLERIDQVVPLASHKYVDYDGDINENFEDIIGVTISAESPLYKIVFWVSDVSKDYVLTKPLHESQIHLRGEEQEHLQARYCLDGGAYFSIECRENYELIRELMSFGKELVVLSPDKIRKKIICRIEDCEKIYKYTNR